MADTEQTETHPAKTRRQPSASYQELVEDREETKRLIGELIADTAERTDRVLVPLMAQTDALRALAGPLTELVGVVSDRLDGDTQAAVDTEEGGNGSAGEAIPASIGTDESAADGVKEDLSQQEETVAEGAAEIDGDTTGETAVSDDDSQARQEPGATTITSTESGEVASNQVEGGNPQQSSRPVETPRSKAEPADNAQLNTTVRPDVDEATGKAADHPSVKGAEAGEEAHTDRREADETEAGEGPTTAPLADMLAVLSAMRDDLGTQSRLIQLIHRTPPPGASGEADSENATRSMRQHHELMERIDGFIVALLNQLGKHAPEDARDPPDRPPPTDLAEIKAVASDLSTQLRAERNGFLRFAWTAAAAGAIALPAMLAVGIFVQREYGIMPVPDPSFGWKDRIWEQMGPEIAGCLNLEDGGAGDCLVTVTPPTE